MEIEIKPRSKMGTSSSITGVVGWCDGAGINFLSRGVLQIWILVWQEPTALAVGADGVVWTFFLPSIISLFSPSAIFRENKLKHDCQ